MTIFLCILGIYLTSCIFVFFALECEQGEEELNEMHHFILFLLSLFWPLGLLIEVKMKAKKVKIEREKEMLENVFKSKDSQE